ncbi:hypothetical protein [Nocardioides sp. BYT-33-1]|jgi:flagellar biosynthesis/type III secretory pathway M-ring protein FliF/YscJ|uniref:hypothetical protein n=1 Tax=Nocardioides sp. BYT-33-1 TaxID=3416952 RepID=UPI003F52AB21
MDAEEWFGEAGDPGWIAVYVVVALVVLGALVLVAMRQRRERSRHRAHELRTQVREREGRLRRHDAEARHVAAESEQARAEADRLEAEAQERRDLFERERAEQQARLREADELDPPARGRHQDDR